MERMTADLEIHRTVDGYLTESRSRNKLIEEQLDFMLITWNIGDLAICQKKREKAVHVKPEKI
jgi:hypothetical protein